jgi:5'-nucleotidase
VYHASLLTPDPLLSQELFSPQTKTVKPVLLPHPKLRVAISLGALFDMTAAALIRKHQGDKKYFEFMKLSQTVPLRKGSAFHFVKNLMKLNCDGNQFVALTILSKLSAETSLRVQHSLRAHNLMTTPEEACAVVDWYGRDVASVFRNEDSSFDLILSTSQRDVTAALSHGISAAYVDPKHIPSEETQPHYAFDFDRCVALALGPLGTQGFEVDEGTFSQKVVKSHADNKGLARVTAREGRLKDIPCHPGPIAPFFLKLAAIREHVRRLSGTTPFPLSIITARTASSVTRAENSLKAWGVQIDHLVSTGWASKGKVACDLGVSVFFDDGAGHIEDIQRKSPNTVAAHVPWHHGHIGRIVETYTPVPPSLRKKQSYPSSSRQGKDELRLAQ